MGEWQDISTAPKTGYIIGAWKDGKWQAAQLWWDDAVEEWTHATGDHYVKPTHWVPLPEPPTASPTPEDRGTEDTRQEPSGSPRQDGP